MNRFSVIAALSALAGASLLFAIDPADPPKDLDVGVYFINGLRLEWRELPVEIVSWKTGGVLKKVFTDGIIKGDLNGRIAGRVSTAVMHPDWSIEILIHPVEGTAAEEYQLIKFREHDDRREFRSVTGGVFHESGGADRDRIPFDATRVGVRLWRVRLDRLTAGQYGFLPPVNASSLGAWGKAYTFSLGE